MSSTVLSIIVNIILQVAVIAIIFGLAYKFGWKMFKNYIAARQNATMEVMYEAEEMKKKATEMHDEAEQKMKDINEESVLILSRTEETAKKLSVERTQKIEEEIARKRDIAEKQLQQEQIRLEQEMEQKVLEKATEVASQFLTSKATTETTEKQIESFLEKLGEE